MATWEMESCLPPHLIAEFEAGVSREVCDNTHAGGDQVLHTLSRKTKLNYYYNQNAKDNY